VKITDADKGFCVLDGANLKQRQWLEKKLLTDVNLVGDRVFFKPTPQVMEFFGGLNNIVIDTKDVKTRGINHDYTLSLAIPDYDHQDETKPKIREMGDFGLIWEVGLGKSKTAIDIAMERFINRQINAVLVITLKGVHKKWISKDLKEHMTIPCEAKAWPISPTKQDKLLAHDGLIVATINFDSMWRKAGLAFVHRMLTMRKVQIVVDESHEVSGHDAQRTKALMKIAPLAKFRMILTGTLIPSTPLQLWSQFEIMRPGFWNMNYYQYKARYSIEKEMPGITYQRFNKKTQQMEDKPVKTVVGYKNLEELNAKITPWVTRYDKSVLNLPEQLYAPEYFDLTDEQRKIYNKLVKDKMAEFKDQPLTAEASLKLRIRLNQITQGYFIADDGAVHHFDVNPRMDSLVNVLQQIPPNKKALIWAPFRESILLLRDTLTKFGGGLVEYWGDTPDNEREANVYTFQHDPNVRWFLANPAAAGTGLTLTAATYALYYANSTRRVHREQSEGRPHRIGQTEPVTYVDFIANGSQDEKQIETFRKQMDMAAVIQGSELPKWLVLE
jgi:SNF2 family DNA or RNA helicase